MKEQLPSERIAEIIKTIPRRFEDGAADMANAGIEAICQYLDELLCKK